MQYTRVLALGDSITYGARSTFGSTYPMLLERDLASDPVPAVVVNAGVNGERSWEIVERAWTHLGADPWYRFCVCMMGTNDSKPAERTPPALYLEQWDRLQHRCRVTDTILVAVEAPWLSAAGQPEYDAESAAHVNLLNEHLEHWAGRRGVEYVGGIFAEFATCPHLLADGVHPTNQANGYLTSQVAKALRAPRSARNL